MSTVKILLSVVIIIGGGYIGLIIASRFDIRVRQLEQIRLALEQMSFSIGFLKLPVAEALQGAGGARRGVIGRILSGAAKSIETEGVTPKEAIAFELNKNKTALCLIDDDIDIIVEFASGFGTGDAEGELSNLRAACARLKIAQTTAEGERDNKAKMWRGIGLLGGVFAVVILF